MTFDALVNRVTKDKAFRDSLRADPEKTLKEAGVKTTPELVHALKTMDWNSVHKVNDHFKAAQGVST